jgi:alginate O-acetyltransferase complex protein AlgI
MSVICYPTDPLPRWVVMWVLAAAWFWIGKVTVLWAMRRRLAGAELAGFVFGWVGMDARPFVGSGLRKWPGQPAPSHPTKAGAGSPGHFLGTAANVLLGAALLWIAARHFTNQLAQGWCGMIGLILILHFGLFRALTHFWRALGIDVKPIMNCPAAATSLAEFWGRRWNRAFRDLVHPFVFRPVARRWGKAAGLWACFLVSGLVHDAIISVPAGAGYGLPTAYFLLQGLGITLERRVFAKCNVNELRLPRWLFTHAFTTLPAFFLFHPPFVERVMAPFFHAIGALP